MLKTIIDASASINTVYLQHEIAKRIERVYHFNQQMSLALAGTVIEEIIRNPRQNEIIRGSYISHGMALARRKIRAQHHSE